MIANGIFTVWSLAAFSCAPSNQPNLCMELPMKTAQQWREEIAALDDRVEALCQIVAEEKRELTDEEREEVDSINGTGKDNPGKVAELTAHLKRAENIENRQMAIAASRVAVTPGTNGTPATIDTVTARTVPATAQRHGNLTAFKDPFDAYASGQFIRAVLGRNQGAREWCGANGISIKAVMTEDVNTAGGFLVPAPMEASIIRLVEEYGVFRRKAMPWTMTSDSDSFPKRTGGLTRYYPGEAGTITASQPTVGRESLLAVKMATMTRMSSELEEDAIISIADWLAQEIATTFANGDDEDGFNGDGTSTYGGRTGILNKMGAGSKKTAASGNTAFSTLDDVDFLGMMGKLANYTGIMPEWYISPEGFHDSMARLVTAAGGAGKADMEDDLRPRFHGRPVNFVNVMNSTLTAQTSTDGLCYYGDLRMAATLGVRRGITIAADSSKYFDTDEIAVKATQRTGQNVHDAGSADTAGAIVGLTTPGS